jgi:hypothetical protein
MSALLSPLLALEQPRKVEARIEGHKALLRQIPLPNETGPGFISRSFPVPLLVTNRSKPTESTLLDVTTNECAPAIDSDSDPALEATYVFEDRRKVIEFIKQNRLRGLLRQAVKPLEEIFGRGGIKILRIVTDDEGAETLFCLALSPDDLVDAQRKLACFDQRWWLNHCQLRPGLLNFDFELV